MDGIRILVAEDDREINRLVAGALQREGYAVTGAADGEEALRLLSREPYEMVILDLMMPRIDGYEVLRRIREQGGTPVLILSARSRETDKIMGLGLGADDYLAKPFGVGELVARVQALLRRSLAYSPEAGAEIIHHGAMEMNTRTYEVTVEGRPRR